jgi:dTDP-4-amino-4,6-dideoxygalactose transaminase
MRVPFFNYPRLYTDNSEAIHKIVTDVGSRGAFIMQRDLREFETKLAKYCGVNYAIGVGNATDGLEFAWMALGLKQGDEVIFCSHTMVATASAIKTAGGVPIPVEIGYDGLIDPDAIEAAITNRTVGIMPTQLNGRTCNMDRIMGIADKHKLLVVEDAAQALGSSFKGRHAGSFGQAAAISFFPAKVLGCLGDGGGVITNDPAIYDRIYQLHDHGRNVNGDIMGWGRNSRLDNLQAAILNYQIERYQDVIDRRRFIASIYNSRLSNLDEIQLPQGPDADHDHFDIYQNYEMQCERRDELRDFLKTNEIGTLIQWGGRAVHQWEYLGIKAKLPRVERFFERCLMLPINMFISDDDVHFVCDQIERFYRK